MESFLGTVQLSLSEDSLSASPDLPETGPGFDQQTAFRRLASATLHTAIQDALGPESQPAYSAIRWLARDTSEGITMEICCNLLGLAPERILPRLSLHSEVLRERLSRYRKVAVNTRVATLPAPWLSNAHAAS